MKSEVHPLSGATYTELGDGKVRVEKAKKYGIFQWDGIHLEGDLMHADPHLLQWVGGPELPAEFVENDPRRAARMQTGRDAAAAQAQYTGGTALAGEIDETFTRYTGDPGRDTPAGRRSSGISFMELLEGDQYPERIPDTLRMENSLPGGVRKTPTERYTSKKWHDLEVERLWKKIWQMACHVDDIPEVGDYIVYDVAHLSYIVVRTGENEFKSYNNACLHRGRQLREFDGKQATEFRCPFHGWCWEVDGSLREIPSEWDFPEVREDASHLREAKTGTWGGFVFINPDPDSESFEDYLGDLPEALREVRVRDQVQADARRQDRARQLESEPGSLHGGLPHHRHPPAAHDLWRRRRQPPVRLIRQLVAGRHGRCAHQRPPQHPPLPRGDLRDPPQDGRHDARDPARDHRRPR